MTARSIGARNTAVALGDGRRVTLDSYVRILKGAKDPANSAARFPDPTGWRDHTCSAADFLKHWRTALTGRIAKHLPTIGCGNRAHRRVRKLYEAVELWLQDEHEANCWVRNPVAVKLSAATDRMCEVRRASAGRTSRSSTDVRNIPTSDPTFDNAQPRQTQGANLNDQREHSG